MSVDLCLARQLSEFVQGAQVAEAECLADARYHGVPCIRPGGAAKLAPPGLVSVPTSGRATEPQKITALRAAIIEQVGAFEIDPAASRWARLRRSIGVAARAHEAVADRCRTVMITLTYARGNAEWEPRHISDLLKKMRSWFAKSSVPFRYVWVAEIQTARLAKTGVAAIHYHLAVWLPEGLKMPKPDDAGWWPWGMTRIETARKAVPYLMHYLQKSSEVTRASLPLGARCHGRGGLGEKFRAVVRWLSLPAFIQARADVSDRWHRAPGGGWVSPIGVVFASEFQRVCVAGRWVMQRVAEHGRPFSVDGPYSRLAAC